jgi:hypothetical protein
MVGKIMSKSLLPLIAPLLAVTATTSAAVIGGSDGGASIGPVSG